MNIIKAIENIKGIKDSLEKIDYPVKRKYLNEKELDNVRNFAIGLPYIVINGKRILLNTDRVNNKLYIYENEEFIESIENQKQFLFIYFSDLFGSKKMVFFGGYSLSDFLDVPEVFQNLLYVKNEKTELRILTSELTKIEDVEFCFNGFKIEFYAMFEGEKYIIEFDNEIKVLNSLFSEFNFKIKFITL